MSDTSVLVENGWSYGAADHSAIARTLKIDGYSAEEDERAFEAYHNGEICWECHFPMCPCDSCWCDCAHPEWYDLVQPAEGGYQQMVWTEEGKRHLEAARRDACDYVYALEDRTRRRAALVRWELVRRAVRARSVAVFWMGEAARSACAVDGDGRRADAAAFAAEFGS